MLAGCSFPREKVAIKDARREEGENQENLTYDIWYSKTKSAQKCQEEVRLKLSAAPMPPKA